MLLCLPPAVPSEPFVEMVLSIDALLSIAGKPCSTQRTNEIDAIFIGAKLHSSVSEVNCCADLSLSRSLYLPLSLPACS